MKYNGIILLGLKHSGKTTLGKELAKKLRFDFYDTDAMIEKKSGISVRELYNTQGPEAFLWAEESVCKEISELSEQSAVISTGGGICDNPPALMHLKAFGQLVFIKNNLNTSVQRIIRKIEKDEEGNFTNVPAFIKNQNPQNIDEIKKMLCAKFTERAELYSKISDIIVKVDDVPVEENLSKLLAALDR